MSNYPQLNNQDILALRKALTLLSGGIGAPAQIAGNALTPPPTTPVVPTGNDTGNEIPGEAIAIGATVAGLGMEYAGFGEKTVGTAHRPGFGLGNTTSLASAGSVLGPWGTAGGAALGLGLDVAKYMRGDKQFKKQVFSQNFHDWREVRNRDLSRQDFTYQMKKGGVVGPGDPPTKTTGYSWGAGSKATPLMDDKYRTVHDATSTVYKGDWEKTKPGTYKRKVVSATNPSSETVTSGQLNTAELRQDERTKVQQLAAETQKLNPSGTEKVDNVIKELIPINPLLRLSAVYDDIKQTGGNVLTDPGYVFGRAMDGMNVISAMRGTTGALKGNILLPEFKFKASSSTQKFDDAMRALEDYRANTVDNRYRIDLPDQGSMVFNDVRIPRPELPVDLAALRNQVSYSGLSPDNIPSANLTRSALDQFLNTSRQRPQNISPPPPGRYNNITEATIRDFASVVGNYNRNTPHVLPNRNTVNALPKGSKSDFDDAFINSINEKLEKGYGLKQGDWKVSVKPGDNRSTLNVVIDGKQTGHITLRSMKKGQKGYENAEYDGLKKTVDYPFNLAPKYKHTKTSAEIEKSISEALKERGERLYSGGTGHSDDGLERYEKHLAAGRVKEIGPDLYQYLKYGVPLTAAAYGMQKERKGGVVKMNTGGQVKDPYQGYHGLEGKKRLQQQLVSLGYDIGPTGVDGILGKNTGKAVKQLQKDNALNVDGISGPQTLALLRTAFEQPGATAASQPEQPASQPATVATAPIQAPENDYEASLNQLTEMYEGGAIDAEGFVNGMALLNKVTGVKTASTPVVSAAPKGPVVNDDGWDYYNPGEWELSDMDGIRAGGVDYRLTGPDGGYDAKETRFIKGGEKYEQPGANAFLSRFREELKDAQVRLKQVGTAKGRPMSVAQYMMNGDDRWQNMDSLIVAEGAGQFGNYDENGMYIPDSLTTRQRNINLMPTTKKMEGTDPYYFRKHGYKLVEGKPLDRNTTTAAEVYGKLRPKDAKARPDQPDQSDILKTTAIWGTSAASAGDPIRDFRDAAEYYKRTGKMLPEWGMQFSKILADNNGDVSKYRYIDTKFRKGGVARLVPVELEAKEIAIMPVGDSYIEILRTPHNIPKHENGGKVYHLPEGAEVFNRELMDRVDEAMKKKNWSEIRNNLVPARDKILEAAQLLGDPYSTGLTSDQAAMYGRKGCKVKGKKNNAMRTYRIGGVAGPGDPPVNEPLPRALGATAEVSAKGTKNYLPTLPDNFFAKNTCKEENCSEYTTTAIANITGQDRSNFDKTMAESAWFKRNKILKNGGIDVWNKERGTEINYDDLQVGDMVSLSNRSMAQPIDYSRDQDVRNGVKKEKYARHSGIIVGKNKDGIPIVEHNIHSKGDKGGTLYREPINDIKEKYTYEPLSVTRPKETINFDFADYKKKVIGSWNAQNTLTDKVSWKRPKVGDELYDAYINVREDLISGYRITAQQADKIFGELYGIAAQESNLMNDLPVESLRDLGSEIKQGIKVITPESVNKLAKVLKSNKSEEGFVPGWKREKAIVELIKGGMDESEAIAKVNEEMPKIKAPYTVTDKSRGYFKQKGISERAKKVFGFDDTGLLSRISLNEKRASRNPYSSTENQIKNAMGLYLENMGKAMEYYPDMDEETKYKVATLAHNTPSTAFNKEYIDFFIKGEGNPDTKKYNSSYINKARGYRDKYLQSYRTGGIIKAQNGTTVTDPPLSYRILGNQLRNNQALIKQLYAQQQLTPQEQMTGLEGMTPDQLALFKRNRAMTAGVGMVAGPTRADMPLQIPSRLPQQADQLGAVPQGLSVDTLQPGPTERYSLREQLSPYLPSFGKMGKINVTKPDIYSMNTILQSGLLANNLMQQAPDYIHLNKPAPTLMRYDSRPVTDMVNKGVDTINSIQRNYDQKGLGMQMMGASMGGAQILQLMNQGGAQQLQGKQAVDAQNAQILNQNDAMRAEVDNQEMNLNLQLQSQYQTMRDQAISKQANSIMQNEFARKQSNEEGQQQKIDNVVQLEALKYAISEGVADSPEWETYRDAKLQEVMTGISTELGDPMNPTNERYKEKLNELSTVYGALAPYSKQEELQRDLDELEKLKKSETSDAIAAAAEIETRITAMQQEKEKEKQAFLTSRLAPTMNNLMLGDMNQLRTERYNESELLKQYRRERGIPDADIATLLKTINSINR